MGKYAYNSKCNRRTGVRGYKIKTKEDKKNG